MKSARIFWGLWLILLCGSSAGAQNFEFAVQHHHTLRDCRGLLTISAEGVEYQAPHESDSRRWKFEEIQVIKIDSPQEIIIVSYEDQKRYLGKDRVFKFKLLDKPATSELSAFLLSHVQRPMTIAVLPDDGKPAFEMRVKHLGAVVGAPGILRIYPDRVVFQSSKVGDSRIWRLADIERFSQPDRFRLQFVSYIPAAAGPTEVYNFQLMQDVPEGIYDYLWIRLHPSSYYPEMKR